MATLGDALAEDDETFTVTLTGASLPAGVSLGTAAATATITDDDALTVSVTAGASTVVEGNAATFTVAVAGGTSTALVAVSYAVAGTATAGTDYTAPSGTLTLGSRRLERDDHDHNADRRGSGRRRDAGGDAERGEHVCGGGDLGRDGRADHDFR